MEVQIQLPPVLVLVVQLLPHAVPGLFLQAYIVFPFVGVVHVETREVLEDTVWDEQAAGAAGAVSELIEVPPLAPRQQVYVAAVAVATTLRAVAAALAVPALRATTEVVGYGRVDLVFALMAAPEELVAPAARGPPVISAVLVVAEEVVTTVGPVGPVAEATAV